MKSVCVRLAVAVLTAGVAIHANAGVIYVNAVASGAQDGTSWFNAYSDLNDALTTASAGDEIWVAAGSYFPPSQTTPFILPSGVQLFGGFDGGETSIDQRHPLVNLTILDGDYNGDDQAGFVNRSDNAERILKLTNTGPNTALDGFVVKGGQHTSSTIPFEGAGLNMTGGSVQIRNCAFIGNQAAFYGGAISLKNVNTVQILDTVFTGNATSPDSTSVLGGALYAISGSNVNVERCLFAFNGAAGVTSAKGGAAYLINCSLARFLDCTFQSNLAQATTGSSGGALYFNATPAQLTHCHFYENQALADTHSSGGALSANDPTDSTTPLVLVACDFIGNRAEFGGALSTNMISGTFLVDSVVASNTADERGGGVYYSQGAAWINGCTIAMNSANSVHSDPGGGIYASVLAAELHVENSILWGNEAAGLMDELAQVSSQASSNLVDYSCVQGWTGAMGGTGNTGSNPLFTDPDGPDDILGTDDDVYFLNRFSPCIDSGSTLLIPPDVTDVDQDGDLAEKTPLDAYLRTRRVDDIDTTDTGDGPAPAVDMGAVEFQFRSCPADLNFDGTLDFFDVQFYLNEFATGNMQADFNGDGVLDFFDVLMFLGLFSSGCP